MIRKIKPKPGQESVWDYPRPPSIELVKDHIRIMFDNKIIFDGNSSFRILETSHPPTYYLPLNAFERGLLIRTDKSSYCEFKGKAHYYHIKSGDRIVEFAAWGYDHPNIKYHLIKDHISIYANKMDECFISDEKVDAQEGDFYGGWITSKVVGPFKGGPGTLGW
ncbi:MAG: DUF427 domain-containing protein [Bacteroidota bacterium]